jgi:hypothetical protein
MREIRTRHLFTLTIEVGAAQPLGPTPAGERIVMPVTGGHFEGERLRGKIVPGGIDWILARTDGAYALDVRLTLATDDAHLIGMTYNGLRHGPADVIARLNRGDAVDPSEYYFRIAPFFHTGSQKYAWLNRIVAIATGERLKTGPVYDVFEVL